MNKFIFILFLYVYSFPAVCQNNVSGEIRFIDYLVKSNQFDDASYLLKKINTDTLNNIALIDSIHYLGGISDYNLKFYEQSANQLLKVSPYSSFYYKSRFFAANTYINLQKYDEVERVINDINSNKSEFNELKSFQLAGNSLLKKDFASYNGYSKNFNFNYYPLVKPEKLMDSLAFKIKNYKFKSPALAGIISAVVPGSGKIYAGKPGQGIAAFFIVSILGAVTVENYIKKGPLNPRTIFCGSLFAAYYIGNIWGSVNVAVNARKNFYHDTDQAILFNLYIPLHTIFD